MLYYFMTIGDYFQTGHEQFKEILISSKKPMKDIREAHFNIIRKTGINLEEICKRYQDDCIHIDMYNKLKEIGCNLELQPISYSEDYYDITPDILASIWIDLLNISDPELKIKRVILDTIHLKDCDKYGRYLRNIGYGCFDNK